MPNPVVPADDVIWVSMFFLESRFFLPKMIKDSKRSERRKKREDLERFLRKLPGRQLSERSRQEEENRRFSTGCRILSSPVSCGKDGNTAGGVPERSAGMEAKAGSVDSLVFACKKPPGKIY